MTRKIIAFSGAQNSGKSTLLNGLKNMGWAVDDYKVSRAVQASMGVDLATAVATPDGMAKFQEAVMAHKVARDMGLACGSGELILTERSFADVAAYANGWVDGLGIFQKITHRHITGTWVRHYLAACKQHQKIYDAVVFIPARSEIAFEHDPNRASKETQQQIDIAILHNVVHFSKKVHIVTSLSVEERKFEVNEFLTAL